MGLKEVISTNLRHYRKLAGLTQEKLGEKAGLHRTYIGRIEQRRCNASLKSIEHIARALDIDPALLFLDTATLPPAPKGAEQSNDLFALVQWTDEGVSIKPLDRRYDDLTIRVLVDLVERGYRDDELLQAYRDAYGELSRFFSGGMDAR
jgi:transcriptional regulator with XRE-family HTH domain